MSRRSIHFAIVVATVAGCSAQVSDQSSGEDSDRTGAALTVDCAPCMLEAIQACANSGAADLNECIFCSECATECAGAYACDGDDAYGDDADAEADGDGADAEADGDGDGDASCDADAAGDNCFTLDCGDTCVAQCFTTKGAMCEDLCSASGCGAEQQCASKCP